MGKNGQFWEILAKSVKFLYQLMQLDNTLENNFIKLNTIKLFKTSKSPKIGLFKTLKIVIILIQLIQTANL
jgi:hypothetical protein